MRKILSESQNHNPDNNIMHPSMDHKRNPTVLARHGRRLREHDRGGQQVEEGVAVAGPDDDGPSCC